MNVGACVTWSMTDAYAVTLPSPSRTRTLILALYVAPRPRLLRTGNCTDSNACSGTWMRGATLESGSTTAISTIAGLPVVSARPTVRRADRVVLRHGRDELAERAVRRLVVGAGGDDQRRVGGRRHVQRAADV